jgi:hypothetical protein
VKAGRGKLPWFLLWTHVCGFFGGHVFLGEAYRGKNNFN